jgi:hypothetical protein
MQLISIETALPILHGAHHQFGNFTAEQIQRTGSATIRSRSMATNAFPDRAKPAGGNTRCAGRLRERRCENRRKGDARVQQLEQAEGVMGGARSVEASGAGTERRLSQTGPQLFENRIVCRAAFPRARARGLHSPSLAMVRTSGWRRVCAGRQQKNRKQSTSSRRH